MKILIIGAGVAGLHIARLLALRGIQAQILEARDRKGGRLLTRNQRGELARPEAGDGWFDLGGTWFWSDQTRFPELLQELGIEAFEQHEEGLLLEDHGPHRQPARYRLMPKDRITFRFAGGGSLLCARLAQALKPEQIRFSTAATRLTLHGSEMRALTQNLKSGEERILEADHVIVTLPPQLVRDTLIFEPELPEEVRAALDENPTWMGHSMKCVVPYARPFWREQGLSGIAVSQFGPVVAFHDAVAHPLQPNEPTHAALFGFFPPSSTGRPTNLESRRAAVLQQLTRLFGPEAATPLNYFEHDWSQDRWTSLPHHPTIESDPAYNATALQRPLLEGRLLFAGTETAAKWGGYLEGAVRSGDRVLDFLLR